ncbi:putative 2-hydroxyacid dehydrogenase [Colletotrichum orbiculare MAFF 240422]|uniref:2-hydroxyacid dehydrogenase n=1 Tax=Colletotrichum orbiculare (strain 104-T / ATCC 96160 / CBS 514.97 / LARS 414 / MAFF 240422) TaxID=1213857 RepID=N4VNQ2_COLOR|nr:putative 2-hydroxyacid dehydrogenase [Colletotrichum orbiculare MAFF 240422]
MTRPKILQLGNIEHAHDSWAALGKVADIIKPKATSRAEFLEEARSGSLDGVVAIYRTFSSVKVTGKIDAELVAALPSSVGFICHNGAGYDQIQVPACSSRNPPVLVSNTPTAVDDATADTSIFLMLGALRNFNASILSIRAGTWRGNPPPPVGHDPQGKVLGILGMGGIGRNMAKKARAFGMVVKYYNRTRLDEETERDAGAEYVGFDELLAKSDVISLNLPLNAHTRHIISTKEFAKMKKGVVVVNTARGAVIDEAALVDALNSGQVGSAGLDVFENEPQVHPGLIANPNVLIIPHMGTWTIETSIKMEEWAVGNVRSAIDEGRLNSVVPEQKDLAK